MKVSECGNNLTKLLGAKNGLDISNVFSGVNSQMFCELDILFILVVSVQHIDLKNH